LGNDSIVIAHEAMIAPGVSAYYHLPPQWIGSEPSELEFDRAPVAELIREQYRTTLLNEIRIRVRRDGLFVFDCSRWEPAGFTEIPAYTVEPGGRIPQSVSKAENAAELRAANRAQLMNAHQACLSTAHSTVHRRSTGLGAIVLPSRAIKLADFEHNNIGGLNSHDPYDRHVSQLLAFTKGYRAKELRARRVIELDTVEFSFKLLDQLLRSKTPGHVQIVELLYRAGVQFSESRFAESLILSWTVCERLLDVLWTTHIEDNKRDQGNQIRMNRDRRDKLKGRDFTASVVLEILELAGRIPHELFERMNDIRRARNSWLHSLLDVSDGDASSAVRAAEQLMEHVTGINISICLSRHGGNISVPKRYYRPDNSLDWPALQAEIRRLQSDGKPGL
jgi:hypothetical protein